MAKNDFQYGGWNSYTLQCGRWLWGDMPLNSPKHHPYWNFTSGFDFDHITAVDMSFCIRLRNFIQIGLPTAENDDVMSIFKLEDDCVHGTAAAPAYLSDSLRPTSEIVGRRYLRSADTTTLQVPSTCRATLGDRAFPVAAAHAWNSLPLETRACSSLLTFRRETKSHLFRQSYG